MWEESYIQIRFKPLSFSLEDLCLKYLYMFLFYGLSPFFFGGGGGMGVCIENLKFFLLSLSSSSFFFYQKCHFQYSFPCYKLSQNQYSCQVSKKFVNRLGQTDVQICRQT